MIVAGTLNLTIIQGCTFEAITMAAQDGAGSPVNLTGFSVAAQVRASCGTTLIVDLAPSITNAAGGIITIPTIADEATLALTAGAYRWDLLLEDGSDNRQQILSGRCDIVCAITT